MVLSMDRWKGKTAVVTGASSGCGAFISELLVRHGVNVAGLSRRSERVKTLSEKLVGEPGKLYALKADVRKEEDIQAAFKWIKANLGPVHILVNNAGLIIPSKLIKGPSSVWKDVLGTNVLGVTIATQIAVQDMVANGVDGHIINMNSIVGHQVLPVPEMNVYSASKFAVTALTETWRQELNSLNSKIKVTSISPGCVSTEFGVANNMYGSDFESIYEAFPKLHPEDIADAVLYILSTPPHVQVQELTVRPIGETI